MTTRLHLVPSELSPCGRAAPHPRGLTRLRDRMVAFVRELDRGMEVMYGPGTPHGPRPAELDTLARTGVIGRDRRPRT